jgi:hypothetical protein
MFSTSSSAAAASKQVIGHKAQKIFHAVFSLDVPKTFFHLGISEWWLWESKLYLFHEYDFSTTFDNVVVK